MALQSNADLRLFSGLLSALFLDLCFHFLILHLISIYTQLDPLFFGTYKSPNSCIDSLLHLFFQL